MSATAPFLSSSPSRSARFNSFLVGTSSPDIPALEDIFSNKSPRRQALRSGSNAAAIPTDARTTFTTAADILRDAPEIDLDTEEVTRSPSRKPKARKPRARKAANSGETVIESTSPKDKPWKQFKTKECEATETFSAPRGRDKTTQSTKPVPAGRAKAKKQSWETVSRHFAGNESRRRKQTAKSSEKEAVHSQAIGATSVDPAAVLLPNTTTETQHPAEPAAPAMARRRDWTPPPMDMSIVVLDSESDNRELLSSSAKPLPRKEGFGDLLDKYGCKSGTGTAAAGPNLPSTADPDQGDQQKKSKEEFLKKRKRIELVSAGADETKVPRERSPNKPAPVRRKIKTITELATAPYAAPVEPDFDIDVRATRDSLLGYFDGGGDVKALIDNQAVAMDRAKDKAKPAKPPPKSKRKKKGDTANQPILLSPSSALRQTSNQDFVFGTSSQLVGPDSPSTLRDLQIAMQASNYMDDDDPFSESESQGLWRAGARDVDGDLLQVEVVDLAGNRVPSRYYQAPRHRELHDAPSASESATKTLPNEQFIDIEDIIPASELSQDTLLPDSIAQRVTQHPAAASDGSNKITTKQTSGDQSRPKYELMTDAQLSRQLNSYGFKPVKKRQAMLALLDQCWMSKHPSAPAAGAQPFSTTTSSTSPKRVKSATTAATRATANTTTTGRPRGRPRKQSLEATTSSTAQSTAPASVVGVVRPRSPHRRRKTPPKEIADSDIDLDSESSNGSAMSPDRGLSPASASASLDEGDVSLALSPTEQQAELFKQISQAVTSAPRSTDPAKPSWHEKMLLYDPIILEDFTAWLNAGELSRVGHDGEASPVDVKAWCESKSVIWIWKRNLHGKERRRL